MMTDPSPTPGHEPRLDEGLDPEGPSAADLDRFGSEFTTCPRCSEEFYDQADTCPHCGDAMLHDATGLPKWAVFTVILVLGALVLYWVF